jgi:hypothetical protein
VKGKHSKGRLRPRCEQVRKYTAGRKNTEETEEEEQWEGRDRGMVVR